MGIHAHGSDVVPLAVITTLLVLCWIAASTRIYVKQFILRKCSIDDKLVIVALLCITTLSGLHFKIQTLGLGHHNWELPEENVAYAIKLIFVAELLYTLTIVVLKLSVAGLLLSVAGNKPIHRRIIIITTIFSIVAGIAWAVVHIFQCTPVFFFWELTVDLSASQACLSREKFIITATCNAAATIISNGIFVILPISLLWNMHMERKTKVLAAFVLGLGFGTVGISAARFFYFGAYQSFEDYMSTYMPLVILSNAEVCIGLIAASLAILQPLIPVEARKPSHTMIAVGDISQNIIGSTKGSTTEKLPVTQVGEQDDIDPILTVSERVERETKAKKSSHNEVLTIAHNDATASPVAIKSSFWNYLLPTIGFNPDQDSEREMQQGPVIAGNPSWRPTLKNSESTTGLLKTTLPPLRCNEQRSSVTTLRKSIITLFKPTCSFNPDTLTEKERQRPIIQGNPTWRPNNQVNHTASRSQAFISTLSPRTPPIIDTAPQPSWWRRLFRMTTSSSNELSMAEGALSINSCYYTQHGNSLAHTRTITILPAMSTRDCPPTTVCTTSDIQEWADILVSAQKRASAMAASPNQSFSGDTLYANDLWDENNASVINLPKLHEVYI